MSRFVRPETVKLELTRGDWLLVKRRLTAGEERHAFARILKPTAYGEPMALDFERTGLAKMVAYLLDWSLADDGGVVVPIRDQPAAVVEAALLSLDPSSFAEIHHAITTHEAAQLDALEAEKKTTDTENRFSRISTSVG
jgi:hypothetical protein